MPHMNEAEWEMFREYRRTRVPGLRNELVARYKGLAVALANGFRNRGEPFDDLLQVAQLGILRSVERFEPDLGVSFTAFAASVVSGEIKKHFRDCAWPVRVPRQIKELHVRLGMVAAKMAGELGRAPTISELAERLETTDERVMLAMEAGMAFRTTSISRRVRHEAEDQSVGDLLAGADDVDFEAVEDRILVVELLRRLPYRDRQIMFLRFYRDMSQTEIARELGISQMHVSRLIRRSLQRLEGAVAISSA